MKSNQRQSFSPLHLLKAMCLAVGLAFAVPPSATAQSTCAPVPSSLIGWWRGENNSQDSVGTSHGTLAGNASFAPGKVATAFHFDGSGDFVEIPASPAVEPRLALTIEGWVFAEGPLPGQAGIAGSWDDHNGDYRTALFWLLNGQLHLFVSPNGGSFQNAADPNPLPIGEWVHVAGTCDGSSVRVYRNGELVGSVAYGGGIAAFGRPFFIGRTLGGSDGVDDWRGSIDELSLYNVALTPEQIRNIYLAGAAGKCGGPVPPTIICPANISVQTANPAGEMVTFAPTASGPSGSVTVVCTPASGSTFPLGTTTVDCHATDNGQTANCSFTITVSYLGTEACPPNNALFWWRFDGNLIDSLLETNGAPHGGVSYISGLNNQALSLNGSDGYAAVPYSASLMPGVDSYTLEGWFRTTGDGAIFSFNECSDGGDCFAAAANIFVGTGQSKLYGYLRSSETGQAGDPYIGQTLQGNRVATDGQWHHFALVRDVSAQTNLLYLDGTEETSVAADLGTLRRISDTTGGQPRVLIGANFNSGSATPSYFFNGAVENLVVYHRALTSAEVYTRYRGGLTGNCDPVGTPTITCPGNITQQTGNPAGTAVTFAPTTSGGSGSVTIVCTPASGSVFPVGTTTVNCTARDSASQSASCSFTVTVNYSPDGTCPPPAGAVAWWRGEGNTEDSIGNNDGYFTDSAGDLFWGGHGTGQAFHTRSGGLGSYRSIVQAPILDLDFTGSSFTWETWVNPSGMDNYPVLLELGGDSGPELGPLNKGIRLQLFEDPPVTELRFGSIKAFIDSPDPSVISTPGAVTNSQWNHIVFVLDHANNEARLYANGVLVGSAPGVQAPTAFLPILSIGGPSFPVDIHVFNGGMDEVVLYNRALTGPEILARYHCDDPTPPCLPPPSGLLGWWRGENNALDQQGNNHGTASGTLAYDDAPMGRAFRFDGVSSSVRLQRQVENDFTLAAWMKSSVPSRTGSQFYEGDGFIYSDFPGFNHDFGASILNGKFAFGIGQPNVPDQTIQSATTVNSGQWIHVAAVRQGSVIRVYINGVEEATQDTGISAPLNAQPFIDLGGNVQDGRYYNGLLDEVLIFNRALTAQEILAIHQAGGASLCAAPTITITPATATVSPGGTIDFAASGGSGTFTFSIAQNNSGGGIDAGTGVYTAGNQCGVTDTIRVTDANNQTADATVTIVDTVAPVITTCAPARTLPAGANCQAALPDLTSEVTATDACGAPVITQTPAAGAMLVLGTHTVTLRAADAAGNASTCDVIVTVADTIAPIITSCAPSQTLSVVANCQAALPNLTGQVTATDDCGLPTITQTPAAGTLLTPGTHTVTFRATDAAGNFSTCDVIVTVADTAAPTITSCAPSQTLSAGANCQVPLPDLTGQVTATDNCGTPTITQTPAVGTLLTLGTYTITLRAADGTGNSSTCETTVTVIDTTPPVIACPANIAVENYGTADATVTFSVPATDDCSSPLTVSCNPASGARFPVGVTTVNCTTTDAAGNSASCSFTVNVVDRSKLIAGGSVWKYLDNGTDPGPAWTTAGFGDDLWNSGPAQLGYGDGDEATLVNYGPDPNNKHVTTYFRHAFTVENPQAIGELKLHLLRDDGAIVYLNGHEILRDNIPAGPVNDQTLASAAAISEDFLPAVTLNASCLAGGLVSGRNVLAVEVHQATVNSSDLGFDLELVANATDSLAPTIHCPAPITVNSISTEGVAVNFSVTAEDECGTAAVSCVPPSGSVFPLGTTMVNCTATDAAGNSSSCSFTVTVLNRAMLIASGSVWNYLDNGSDQGTQWRNVDFPDTAWSSGPAQLGYGDGDEATVVNFGPDANNKHVTTYFRHRFTVADPATYGQLILRLLRDDGAVVYLNGHEILRDNLPVGAVTYQTLAESALTTEDFLPEVMLNSSCLVAGMNVLAVEVHQAAVASSDLGFDLELIASRADTVPPSIHCPAPITAIATSTEGAVVNFNVTADDGCTVVTVTCLPPSGSAFQLGTTTVDCTATDTAGNSSACSFTVTVNVSPDSAYAYFTSFESGIGPEWSVPRVESVPEFTQFSGRFGNESQTLTVDSLVPGKRYALEFDLYLLDSWDGNSSQFGPDLFNVAIDGAQVFHETFANSNGEPPTDTQTFSGSPEGGRRHLGFNPNFVDAIYRKIRIPFVANGPAAVLTFSGFGLQALSDESWGIDNVGIRKSVTLSPASATVAAGGTVNFTTFFGTAPYTWSVLNIPAHGMIDGLSGVYQPSGGCGGTDIILVTDANGDTAQATVQILDITPPNYSCWPSLVLPSTSPQGRRVDFPESAFVDDCGDVATVTCEPHSGSKFPIGTTSVNCTATDPWGNASTCSFTLTIDYVDAPPEIVCAPNRTIEVSSHCEAVLPDLTGQVRATDFGGQLTIWQTPPAGAIISRGAHTVTITVQDEVGRQTTCSATVTGIDTTPPSITCPPNQILDAAPNGTASLPNYTRLVRWTDACAVTVAQSPAPGTPLPIGTHVVSFTARDASGNAATCAINVKVRQRYFTVSGRVTTSGGAAVRGLAMNLVKIQRTGRSTVTQVTDSSGSYSFTVPANTTIVISPDPSAVASSRPLYGRVGSISSDAFFNFVVRLKSGGGFLAASANDGGDPDPQTPLFAGLVLDTNGAPLSSVTVELTGDGNRTTNTTEFGDFLFEALPINGTFTVVPSLANRNFNPPSATITNLIDGEFVLFVEQPLEPFPLPVLSMQPDTRFDGQLTITWPGQALDFVLESSPSLSEPDWQPAPEQQLQDEGPVIVPLEQAAGRRFFRLRNP